MSDEELSREIQQFAEQRRADRRGTEGSLDKGGRLDSITEQVRHRKALDLVITSAEIRTEEIEDSGAKNAEGEDGRIEIGSKLSSQALITALTDTTGSNQGGFPRLRKKETSG